VKRLDRYVLKELAIPFLIGTACVVLMFMANLLIYLLRELELQSIPTSALLQLILFKTPSFLNMTLPVGTALGASLALSRLCRESEITAMRSAGAPILRVIAPVALFGILVAGANFYVVESVMPPAEREFSKLKRQVGVLAASPTYRANAVIYLQNFTATFGEVKRGKDGQIDLTKAFFIQDEGNDRTTIYRAPRGYYKSGIWKFEDAKAYMFEGNVLRGVAAKRLIIDEKITVDELFAPAGADEQTLSQLRNAITESREMGRPATQLELAYHVRFSVPAACFVFSIAACGLAVAYSKNGAFMGVLLSLAMVLLYYNVFIVSTQILGRNGWVSPVMAAWLPNLIFGVFGVFVIRRLE
jgi:lipopolysaccharide export system permease protein